NSDNNKLDGTHIVKRLVEEDNTNELWDVQLAVNLSPRQYKSARKGKKQVNDPNKLFKEFDPTIIKSSNQQTNIKLEN
ncbi:hypothetical protein H5410_036303, partial [Solanum commersonii]